MLEQITGEVVKDDEEEQQPSPKGKLASMKKKVKTMETELRSKVPVSKVKKEDEDFVSAMQDQYMNRPEVIAARLKAAKLKAMKSQSETPQEQLPK